MLGPSTRLLSRPATAARAWHRVAKTRVIRAAGAQMAVNGAAGVAAVVEPIADRARVRARACEMVQETVAGKVAAVRLRGIDNPGSNGQLAGATPMACRLRNARP